MSTEIDRIKSDISTITRAIDVPAPFGSHYKWGAIAIGIIGIAILAVSILSNQIAPRTRMLILIPMIITLPVLLPYLFAKGPFRYKTGYKDLDSTPLAMAIAAVLAISFLIQHKLNPSFQLPQILVPIATGLACLSLAVGKPHRECLLPVGIAITAYGFAYAFLPGWAHVPAGGIMIIVAGFGAALILHLQSKEHDDNVHLD